jgi:hypothetical protein
MKKTSLLALPALLLLFAGCQMDPEKEFSGHRQPGGDPDVGSNTGWEGYSIDNLPPASYWNTRGENWNWPNPFVMIDGTPVTTKEQWAQRYEEIKVILQHYLYGYLPPNPDSITAATTYSGTGEAGGGAIPITITITHQGRPVTREVSITLPTNGGGFTKPWPLSLGGITGVDGVRGYAIAAYPSWDADINTLYQYRSNDPNAPSSLINTAWSSGRLIDALEQLTAAGQPLAGIIDPSKITITGHSRGGKDAIVAAAFEPRIGVAAPSSSGALGIAPERFYKTMCLPVNGIEGHTVLQGKGYWYMDRARGSSTNVTNPQLLQYLVNGIEPPGFVVRYGPIQSVQNYDHARWDGTSGANEANGIPSPWVSGRFMEFTRNPETVELYWTSENGMAGKGSLAQTPFDQHFLTALMAGPDPDHPRALIISSGVSGDSWCNPEGCYLVFLATREVYKFLNSLGVKDPNGGDAMNELSVWFDDPNGHVHTAQRRGRQLDLADYVWRGVPLPADFMDLDADGSFYGQGAEYPLDIRSLEDYKLLNWAAPGEKSLADIATEFFATNPQYPQ